MMRRNILLLCGMSLMMLMSCGPGYNSNGGGGGGGGDGGGGGGDGGGGGGDGGGGGGNGGGAGGSFVGVQGVYSGIASSSGYTFWTIILPNGELFGIYGTVNGNQLLLDGMITGQGAINNGVYTASVTDIFYKGSVKSGTFSASCFSGVSMCGTLTE